MGLTLVTGPANSAKAQVVLERYRAVLARDPILVVPRVADVEHYRRELAGAGAVIGVRVEAFSGLIREIAQRAGVAERALGEHARRAVLAAVTASSALDVLQRAAAAPGFIDALGRFVAELEARRVDPARFTAALRGWAGEHGRRRAYADELAALYGGYRRRLERMGRLDSELLAGAALDALRLAPERWGRTAVFAYGFDDLDPLQRDAIETLAHAVGAPVTVSLPGEPGRLALAGRATTLETLRARADEVVELSAQAEYYEDAGALHHVERSLFERATRRPVDAAVKLLEGGDEHAEAELVAAEVAGLIASGFAPGEIAVVTRASAILSGELVAAALEQLGVAVAFVRRERFADSAVGRGLLALLRCAHGEGDAAELVKWLRTPGLVDHEEFIDRFEEQLVRGGIRTLAGARELWEREHWPLDALDRVAAASRRGGEPLLDRVERELEALFAAPHERAAALIDPLDAATVGAARRALRELRELARAQESIAINLTGVLRALEGVSDERHAAFDADAVLICDALSLRARRVRALFICALQEGSFPAAAREELFLGARERSEIAIASGLVLAEPTDALASERYLFYALCSRPTARLVVSWHDATDDGEAALRSLFADDLADCFETELLDARPRRAAGAIAWAPEEAPAATALEQSFAQALAEPRRRARALVAAAGADSERVAALRRPGAHSASSLERWLRCPVSWFVERGLGAKQFEPDNVNLARGAVAHAVLASIYAALAEQQTGRALDQASLPSALAALDRALEEQAGQIAKNVDVDLTERRRMRSDLQRYLRDAAAVPARHAPVAVELGFGVTDAEHPPVVLADGDLELCGRVDRVDVDPASETAIVWDYKATTASSASKWQDEGLLQPALYMRVVEQLLGVEAVGGLYQPLRPADIRPHGALREDIDLAAVGKGDRLGAGELRELLASEVALACAVARELERGALAARPQTCLSRGGCQFPTICRCEAQ